MITYAHVSASDVVFEKQPGKLIINNKTSYPRKAHTHSDTGFQLTQVTLGRKVREQKGAWVRALERFNIVVTKAAAIKSAAQLLGTNRFVGSIMETP